MSGLTFKECPSCAAKPGTPVLCESCLHNRRVITELASRVAASPHISDEELFLNAEMEKAADEHETRTEENEDGHRAIAYCKCPSATRYRILKDIRDALRNHHEIQRRNRGQMRMLTRIRTKADLATGIDTNKIHRTPDDTAMAGRAAGAEGAVDLLIAKYASRRSLDGIKTVTGYAWCTQCGCVIEGGTDHHEQCMSDHHACVVDLYIDEGIDT